VARYYYDKYFAERRYGTHCPWGDQYTTNTSGFILGSLTYDFNSKTGLFSIGPLVYIYKTDNDTTTTIYIDSDGSKTLTHIRWHDIPNDKLWYREYVSYDMGLFNSGVCAEKGIIAEDGTYPDDGYDSTTGYWYVKGAIAFPAFHMKIDGQLKTSENGWVKIDGVLRPIEKIWVKINGELKVV
jgi:hypothetical protein